MGIKIIETINLTKSLNDWIEIIKATGVRRHMRTRAGKPYAAGRGRSPFDRRRKEIPLLEMEPAEEFQEAQRAAIKRYAEISHYEKSKKPYMRMKPVKYLRKEGNRYFYKEPKGTKRMKGANKIVAQSKHLASAIKEIRKLTDHYENMELVFEDKMMRYGDKSDEAYNTKQANKYDSIGKRFEKQSDRARHLVDKLIEKEVTLSDKMRGLIDRIDTIAAKSDPRIEKKLNKLTDYLYFHYV